MGIAGEVWCGRPFRLPAAGALRLTGRFPHSARAGQTLSGTAELESRDAIRGVTAPVADAFLVREGLVVTAPLPRDAIGVRVKLAPGEPESLPALAALVSCEDGQPLPPGRYEVYARLVLTPDDGAAQRVFGGPWTLRLR